MHVYAWKASANEDRSGVDLSKRLLFTRSINAESVWGVGDERVVQPDFAEWCLRRIVDPDESAIFVSSVNDSLRHAAVLPETTDSKKQKVWCWEGTIMRPGEDGTEAPVRVRARSVPTFDHETGTCVWDGHMEAKEVPEAHEKYVMEATGKKSVSQEVHQAAVRDKEVAQSELQQVLNGIGNMGLTVMTGTIVEGETPIVSVVPTNRSFLGIKASDWVGLSAIHNLCPKCLEEDIAPKIEKAISSPNVFQLSAFERRYDEAKKEWRRIKAVVRYGPLSGTVPRKRTFLALFQDVEDEEKRKDKLQMLLDTVTSSGAHVMLAEMQNAKEKADMPLVAIPVVKEMLTEGSYLGTDASDWIGKCAMDKLHPEDLQLHARANIARMAEGKVRTVCHIERRYDEKRGGYRRQRIAVKIGDDKKTMMAVHVDVEDELRAAEVSADKDAVWGCVDEAMSIVEGDSPFEGRILDNNPALEELAFKVGYQGDIKGHTLAEVLGVKGEMICAKQGSSPLSIIYEFELSKVNDDDDDDDRRSTVINCEATVAKVFLANDKDDGKDGESRMAVVIRDRTVVKELERKQHQVEIQLTRNQTLQTHLKWVQHEVKNSALAMQARVGVLEHLISGLPEYAQESMVDDVAGIQVEVDTLLRGLNDHVVLGCLASCTYSVQWSECRQHELLSKLLRHLGPTTTTNESQRLEVHGLCDCMADPHALKHATYNLESNALKYGVRESLRVCAWIACDKDTWRSDAAKMGLPSAAQYTLLHPEETVVDNIGGMTPGTLVNSDSASKLYFDTSVKGMLCMCFGNEVLDTGGSSGEQTRKFKEMAHNGRLHELFKEGVRVAGEHNSLQSSGDGLSLTRAVIEALMGALHVSVFGNKNTERLFFQVRCVVPVLCVEGSQQQQQQGDHDGGDDDVLPENTCIVALDDCKMQRMLLKSCLKKMGSSFLVLGDQQEHMTRPVENMLHKAQQVQPSVSTIICILDQNLGADVPLGTDIAQTLCTALIEDKRLRAALSGGLHTFIRSANTQRDDVEMYLRHADGVVHKDVSWRNLRRQLVRRVRSRTQLRKFAVVADERAKQSMRQWASSSNSSSSSDEVELLCQAKHGNESAEEEEEREMVRALRIGILERIVNVKSTVASMLSEDELGSAPDCSLCLSEQFKGDLHQIKGGLLSLSAIGEVLNGKEASSVLCDAISEIRTLDSCTRLQLEALSTKLSRT
ncbi:MAG: hypothetical protein CMH41_00840, partial [Micrococcales bacterium]|nr:hypothetical protein [Micrococcales bacterium]